MDKVNYAIKYLFLGGIIGTTVYFGHVVYCLGSETLEALRPSADAQGDGKEKDDKNKLKDNKNIIKGN